jgi:Cu-Zn family superoxide dismutase
MRRNAALLVLSIAAISACGTADDPAVTAGSSAGPADEILAAPLMGPEGAERGSVSVTFTPDGATLSVSASGLPPGLHGFHIHKTGLCEPDSADPTKPEMTGDFLSAGGHLAEEGQTHGDHDGDLPSLLVRADGSANLVVTTDRLSRESLLDSDGSAVMVHEKSDNFGNVPDRYASTLDDTTKKTGDAGPRLACAVLEG